MSTNDFVFSTWYQNDKPNARVVRMSQVTSISAMKIKPFWIPHLGEIDCPCFYIKVEGYADELICCSMHDADNSEKREERTEAFRQVLLEQFQKRYGECWTPKQQEGDTRVEDEPMKGVSPTGLIGAFHAHLDVCAQCRTSPFNLCLTGRALLLATGG